MSKLREVLELTRNYYSIGSVENIENLSEHGQTSEQFLIKTRENKRYLLRIFPENRKPQVEFLIALFAHLEDRTFPTYGVKKTQQEKQLIELGSKLVWMTNFLEGKVMPRFVFRYRAEDFRGLGRLVENFSLAVQDYDGEEAVPSVKVGEVWERLQGEGLLELLQHSVVPVESGALMTVVKAQEWLQKRLKTPAIQDAFSEEGIIHADMNLGNILRRDGAPYALIDYDEAGYGSEVWDYGVAFAEMYANTKKGTSLGKCYQTYVSVANVDRQSLLAVSGAFWLEQIRLMCRPKNVAGMKHCRYWINRYAECLGDVLKDDLGN